MLSALGKVIEKMSVGLFYSENAIHCIILSNLRRKYDLVFSLFHLEAVSYT